MPATIYLLKTLSRVVMALTFIVLEPVCKKKFKGHACRMGFGSTSSAGLLCENKKQTCDEQTCLYLDTEHPFIGFFSQYIQTDCMC